MGEVSDALLRARLESEVAAPWEILPAARPADPERSPSAASHSAVQRASISRERTRAWAARALVVDGKGKAAQGYRRLAEQVGGSLEARGGRTLLVTSALPGEGKTTTACNLALALASTEPACRVALVELDLARPGAATALGVGARAGMERVLAGEASLRAACTWTDLDCLDLYLVANPSRRSRELLAQPRLSSVMRTLAHEYDRVVVDAPPTLNTPEIQSLAALTTGTLAVVRVGTTCRAEFQQMREILPEDRFLGVFLNGAES